MLTNGDIVSIPYVEDVEMIGNRYYAMIEDIYCVYIKGLWMQL
jgi:hypothetical protein